MATVFGSPSFFWATAIRTIGRRLPRARLLEDSQAIEKREDVRTRVFARAPDIRAHVVQDDVLGVEQFARQYVRGLAAGGFDYYAIPLERAAYECQARFELDPQEPFSVPRRGQAALGK